MHAETHVGLAHTHQLLLISLRSDFFFFALVSRQFVIMGRGQCTFPFPALFFFIIILLLCHSLKITKDRVIKVSIASKKISKTVFSTAHD